jgi:protein SCO1/2
MVGAGRRAARCAAAAALVFALGVFSGCSSTAPQSDSAATVRTTGDGDGYHGTLVDPPLAVAPVTLADTEGDRVRLDRLATQKATALFFGFTNCDDVCPTTMADLAAAKRTLPARYANDVSLVFITVDPQRDTPPVLRAWLDQFDADIVGLRGPLARVHRAERSLYASQSARSQVAPPTVEEREHEHAGHAGAGDADGGNADEQPGEGGYKMDHTSVVYLFGPEGRTVIYTGGYSVADYADDFLRILEAT